MVSVRVCVPESSNWIYLPATRPNKNSSSRAEWVALFAFMPSDEFHFFFIICLWFILTPSQTGTLLLLDTLDANAVRKTRLINLRFHSPNENMKTQWMNKIFWKKEGIGTKCEAPIKSLELVCWSELIIQLCICPYVIGAVWRQCRVQLLSCKRCRMWIELLLCNWY